MYKNPVLMYRNQGLAYILECKNAKIVKIKMNEKRKKLGISTVLISVLLIVIALVFVGLLYSFGRGLFGGLSATASLEVTKFDITAGSGGGVLLIEIKNVGNVRITNPPTIVLRDLTTGDDVTPQQYSWNGLPLNAGQSAYLTCSLSGVVAGHQYSVVITAEAENNAKISVSSSTIAHP
jgi:hypothetical protein